MEKFCEYLREHAMKVINFKKKKKLLTRNQQELYGNAKFCCICKEKFENEYLKDNKYCKFGDHCHYTGKYNTTQITSC